jgi:hypothetical protein
MRQMRMVPAGWSVANLQDYSDHSAGAAEMSTTGIWRGTGALAIVAGVAMAATVASAGSVQATTGYQIGTFNMAGGHDTHGPKGNEAPDALVESVASREPAFIVLQEACRDWTDRLDSELRDYTVKFDPVQESKSGLTAKCEHPSDFGNAILFRNDFGIDSENLPAYDLKSPADKEQREMLCVQAEAKKIVVCSMHLSSGDDVKARGRRGPGGQVHPGREVCGLHAVRRRRPQRRPLVCSDRQFLPPRLRLRRAR